MRRTALIIACATALLSPSVAAQAPPDPGKRPVRVTYRWIEKCAVSRRGAVARDEIDTIAREAFLRNAIRDEPNGTWATWRAQVERRFIWHATGRGQGWRNGLEDFLVSAKLPVPRVWIPALLADAAGEDRLARLREALRHGENFFPARFRLAHALLDEGKVDAAAAELPKLWDYRGPEYLLLTARFQIARGNGDEGLRMLRELISSYGRQPEAREHLLHLLVGRNEIPAAVTLLEESCYEHPAHLVFHLWRARLARRQTRFEDALEYTRAALRSWPHELSLRELEIAILIDESRADEATTRLDEGRDFWNEEPTAHARQRCRVAWSKRDRWLLEQALTDWGPGEDVEQRAVQEVRLAYLRGDLPAFESALSRIPAPDEELLSLRRLITTADERKKSRIRFTLGLGAGLLVLAVFAVVILRRRSDHDARPQS